MTEKQGDLGGFIYVVLKRRKFLVLNTLIVTLLVMGISLLLPVRFKATAMLLPPASDGGDLLGLGTLVQGFDVSKLSLTGVSSTAQIHLAVLKSRTVADAIIEEYQLLERYKARNLEVARRTLAGLTDIRLTSTGVIQVSVEDKDPQVAADMANSFVKHLDEINRTLRMSEGRRTRIFIEERLRATEERLRAAEDSLLAFKQNHPGVVLPEDLLAAASASASLMAQRILIGAELEALRSSFHSGAPAVVQKEREVEAFDRQLDNLPALELELGRLFRDFKIQEKVYELLTSQFEEASIRENRDITTVDVLDVAVPPIRKSFPRRGIMTVFAFIFSLFAGLLIVVSLEALEKMRLDQDSRIESIIRPGSLVHRLLFGAPRPNQS